MEEEVAEEWRKLQNEELHHLYSSPHIIEITKSRMRWAGDVLQKRKMRSAYRVSVRKPDGPSSLGMDEVIILR
jgi:hypothetical protein